MGVCNCSMYCCMLLYVHSSFAIILMEKRELIALLSLSSWCLVIVVWLFLAMTWVCLQFLIVVFPGHTHLIIFPKYYYSQINEKVLTRQHSIFILCLITFFISYLSYQLHCCALPDKRCLSHGMLPLSGHDDVALFE